MRQKTKRGNKTLSKSPKTGNRSNIIMVEREVLEREARRKIAHPIQLAVFPLHLSWCLKYNKSSMLFVEVYNFNNSALFIKCQ